MKTEVRAILEKACLRYLEAAPWKTLRDEHFFGVKDEETGLDGWASVAGNVGEEHGIGIYVGRDGRRVLEKTLALDLDVEKQNEDADVIALTVADPVEAADFRSGTRLEATATIGAKTVHPIVFRKPPQEGARSLRDREALFLARTLLGVAKTAEWGLDEDDVLDEVGGRLVVTLRGPTDGVEPHRAYDAPTAGVAMDAALEQALADAPRTKRLLVGLQGKTLVVFDPKAKKLVHEEALALDEPGAAASRVLAVLAGRAGAPACLPREIWTDTPSLEGPLAAALVSLGVKVAAKLDLKELRRAR